jgi:membrane protein YdbS with pleckstrin-like domain
MTDNRGTTTAELDQVSTVDAGPPPTPPLDAKGVPSVDAGQPAGPLSATRAPNQGPQPNSASPQGDPTDPTAGVGTEGELEVWEGRYSMRNYLGRVILLSILSVAWGVMAIFAWGYDYTGLAIPALIAGIVLVLLWAGVLTRMARAHFGYKYRLTTRRLFISTGIFHRETDQLELLRVQDVYNRQQNLTERLLGVGSVIIVSDQKTMPNYVLLGVSDPKGVMDLIWHHARAEQDQRNVRVEQL